MIGASRKGVARGRSNGALGELLQATAYANLDLTGQENAEKLSLRAGNVSCSKGLYRDYTGQPRSKISYGGYRKAKRCSR